VNVFFCSCWLLIWPVHSWVRSRAFPLNTCVLYRIHGWAS
jgi:hypothetical protein